MNINLCEYGCGTEGKFFFKSTHKWCCSKSTSSCLGMRQRNAESQKGNTYGKSNRDRVFEMKPCSHCDKPVALNNHWKHEQWCSGNGKNTTEHVCEWCNGNFQGYGTPRYCSSSCRKEYQQSDEYKQTCSDALKEKYANGDMKPYGGNLKSYEYTKRCGSTIIVKGTYELKACGILDSMIENGTINDWEYETKRIPYVDMDDVSRTYFPDFTIIKDGVESLVEVKGFEREIDQYKWQAAREIYDLDVWKADNIRDMLDNKD